jgi:hypothetical protein
MRCLIAALVAFCLVSSASAQIFYEPIRYQYGDQTPFYYGGSNPDVFRTAQLDYVQAHNGFVEAHGDVTSHKEVLPTVPHIYVDQFPRNNAWVWGYTVDDARNAAYQNAARYFRKRDIVAQAQVDETGALHVMPQASSEHAGTIEIKPYVKSTVAPAKVLIFPNGMLDRKLVEEPKTLASAQ